MNQRLIRILSLFGFFLVMSACQSAEKPSVQTTTPAPQAVFSPSPERTQMAAAPSLAESLTPTVWATPPDLSTPTPVPSPTFVFQNAFAVGFSGDGRLLAFNASVDGLVAGDNDQLEDPFLYHTAEGTIERIAIEAGAGPYQDSAARVTSLSADGWYLLYSPTYNFINMRSLTTGQVERLDISAISKELRMAVITSHLSPNGQFLVLQSAPDQWRMMLYESGTGKMTEISRTPQGQPANGDLFDPAFSPDGRYLAFVSNASNLVDGDRPCSDAEPECGDVFVYEIATGKLERIPARMQFTMGYPYAYLTVSNQARWLAWTELDKPESHYRPVIRLFDRQTGNLETICAGEPLCSGHSPSMSNDGRWVAFATIPGLTTQGSRDANQPGQVYLFDRQTGQRTLVSAGADGQPGDKNSGIIQLQSEGFSSDVRISGDGRFVAFSSQAANLLPHGFEKRQCFDPIIVGAYPCYDLFVYDRENATLSYIGPPAPGGPANSKTPAPIPSITPTVDTTATAIVQALLATVQPRTFASYPSPDGQWRADVIVHDCTKVSAEALDENAYEVLRVTHLPDGQIYTIADQLQSCGGVGGYGLDGITWSHSGRFFYYTTAREGVPDGSGGVGWHRPIYRFDIVTAQGEMMGSGPMSPNGQKIASIQSLQNDPLNSCNPKEFLVQTLDGAILFRAPIEIEQQTCDLGWFSYIAWSAASEEIVYLETSCQQPMECKSNLYRIDLARRDRQTLFQDHQPFFLDVTWSEPDRLSLTDQDYKMWYYSLSTGQLEMKTESR